MTRKRCVRHRRAHRSRAGLHQIDRTSSTPGRATRRMQDFLNYLVLGITRGLDVRADRARLHPRLRRPPADQLRAQRGVHVRGVRQLPRRQPGRVATPDPAVVRRDRASCCSGWLSGAAVGAVVALEPRTRGLPTTAQTRRTEAGVPDQRDRHRPSSSPSWPASCSTGRRTTSSPTTSTRTSRILDVGGVHITLMQTIIIVSALLMMVVPRPAGLADQARPQHPRRRGGRARPPR